MSITGKSGTVTFGTKQGKIKGFNVNTDVNTPDVTTTDSDGWAEYASGIKSWNGTFESLACADLQGSVGIGSFDVGGSGTASASAPIFSGTIIVKGPSVALTVDGEVRYSYQFQGTGPLAIGLGA